MSKMEQRLQQKQGQGLFKATAVKDADKITLDQYEALSAPSQNTKQNVTNKGFKRMTYYIHPVLEEAIACYAFEKNLDKSFVVREALNAYMGKEYITMGIERHNTKED